MRMIEVRDVTLAVGDEGDGPAVVLLHGFPELAYSWRHQIPALVDAGYRVIAFDQRGYGASDKPQDVASYELVHLADDVVGVLDRLGIDTATVVGHDWGSIVAYTAALLHPERVDGVVSLNVPYRGACWGFPTISYIREHMPDRFGYVLMFQEPGAAEAGFEANPGGWLTAFYVAGARGRVFLTEEEFDVYRDAFTEGGITGPVNWYRNIDANAARLGHLLDATIDQRALLIAADSDPVLPLTLTEGVERWMPNIERIVVDDCGHWTQQERPDAVNAALVDWLGS
jgi:pimeloyl-ACP methyl ester carboxylesterase